MANDLRHSALRAEPLSLDAGLAAVRDPGCGAVAVFLGLVRDHDHGRGVTALDYTAHPRAAETLAACAEQVAARHDVRVWVEHRVGHLEVGDTAVAVVAAAAHRGPALTACRELIEELKAGVPIWKEQRLVDGDVEWVGL